MIKKYKTRLHFAALILGVGFLFCWVNLFVGLPLILISSLGIIRTMDTLEKLESGKDEER